MNKFKKIIISVMLAVFLVLTVANVSAGDLVVNKNTTYNDIDTWMKNSSTVKGNNLIFNTTKYELTDTINVSKAVNIKSNVKTQINFNKNKNMFNVSANGITFSGLTLNHNGKGDVGQSLSLIFSNSSKSVINIKNMNFNLNNYLLGAITILNWEGNVSNSVFKSNQHENAMISAGNWTGNIYKSTMSLFRFNTGIFTINWIGNFSYSKISFANGSSGIYSFNWRGNLHKSNITSNNGGWGVYAHRWSGKVLNSMINIKGTQSYAFFVSSSSKGSISKSNIFAKKGWAIYIPKTIKVSNTKAKSSKYVEDIIVMGPRVYAERYSSFINYKYLLYKFKVYNDGESKSKTSYLTLTYGKYKKTVKIKALKSGKSTIVKIIIPKSFKKSKKKVTTTYTNGAGVKSTSKPWIIK